MSNKDKIKVLQVIPAMQTGGVERGVHDISTYSNDEFEILVASSGGKLAEAIEKKGVKHFQLSLSSKNPITIFFNIFKLNKIIKKENIKIVHARSRAPAWSAYFAAKQCGVKFVTTFHGFYKIQSAAKGTYNSVMTKGDIVISVSEFMKDHISDNYRISDNKIQVIHRGVDMQEFNPLNITEEEVEHFKADLGLAESDKKILILPGRISRWKAQDTAIKAISLLEEEKRPILLIAGSWKGKEGYYQELNDLAQKLGVSKNVIFTGNLGKLAVAYASSDIGLNCSREPETFGRVTAETGAMGKPVIASALGGSKEIVKDGETGSLFEVEDEEQLSEKILYWCEYISEQENMDKISAVTRKHISDNFSLDKMCLGTFEVYRDLLSS